MWIVLVAVVAGAITTISGFGGGLLLLLAVTALTGARAALAATAVALLVANAHRVWLYRRDVGRRVTAPLLAGLVPGALAGGWLASAVPVDVVHAAMLAVVGASVLRAWRGWAWRPGPRALGSSGAVVGVLAGSAGGAGFLVGPIVLSAGLEGRRYLATVAVAAVAMHVARLVGYGAGGLMTPSVLRLAALLTPALLVGNLLGDRLRDAIPDAWHRRIELGAPIACVALALAGVG